MPSGELAKLHARLAEAEETLHAIRTGEADAVVTAGKDGLQVFTLEGAGHAYRVLIESMSEGALILTTDTTILYANQCFARMVKCPLEQVIGNSLRRFLSAEGQAKLRPLLKRTERSGAKIQVWLTVSDGSQLPVQISIRPLARNGSDPASVCMVVTDMTDARRTEDLLRKLTHRVVQAQEAERGSVALALHDDITQMLCAVLIRSQALAEQISEDDGASKREAIKLRELLGQTAEEVESISRNLRPSVLDLLGLIPALRAHCTDFAQRTGISLKLAFQPLTNRLPAESELALYRILQKALENVEKHSHARQVTVGLRQRDSVRLTIQDDGLGFDSDHHTARQKGNGDLGLLSMRERASYVGAAFKIKSVPGAGTEIEVLMPLPPPVKSAG